jgi:hypothetical protein
MGSSTTINCVHCEQPIGYQEELALVYRPIKIHNYHKDCYKEIVFDRKISGRLMNLSELPFVGWLIIFLGLINLGIAVVATLEIGKSPAALLPAFIFFLMAVLSGWFGLKILKRHRFITQILLKEKSQ